MKDMKRQKKNQQAWYKKNKEYMLDKQRAQRAELRRWLKEDILAGRKCKCGEDHPGVFEFHHRDPAEKEFEISTALDRKFSKERILKEMSKCEILCANCHRKLHWEEKNGIVA